MCVATGVARLLCGLLLVHTSRPQRQKVRSVQPCLIRRHFPDRQRFARQFRAGVGGRDGAGGCGGEGRVQPPVRWRGVGAGAGGGGAGGILVRQHRARVGPQQRRRRGRDPERAERRRDKVFIHIARCSPLPKFDIFCGFGCGRCVEWRPPSGATLPALPAVADADGGDGTKPAKKGKPKREAGAAAAKPSRPRKKAKLE